MLNITYTPGDADLAARIQKDLQNRDADLPQNIRSGERSILIAILSPAGVADDTVQKAIEESLDAYEHIIPVITSPVALPQLIDNLEVVDFSKTYQFDALLERIQTLAAENAPTPMTALTQRKRAANRRVGLVILIPVAIVFAASIYGIAVLGLRAPTEELEAIETEDAQMIDTIVAPTLEAFAPRSTDDALNFESTLEAVQENLQPFLIGTATAVFEADESGE